MKDYKIITYLLNTFYFPMLCVKYPIKIASLHSCICPSVDTHPGFSGINANRIHKEIVLSTKIIKLRSGRVKEKSQ